jgi:hypothetical protein
VPPVITGPRGDCSVMCDPSPSNDRSESDLAVTPLGDLTRFEENYTFHARATYGEACVAIREITQTVGSLPDGRLQISMTFKPRDKYGITWNPVVLMHSMSEINPGASSMVEQATMGMARMSNKSCRTRTRGTTWFDYHTAWPITCRSSRSHCAGHRWKAVLLVVAPAGNIACGGCHCLLVEEVSGRRDLAIMQIVVNWIMVSRVCNLSEIAL